MKLDHDLIEHDTSKLECRICQQTWRKPPVSRCPGIRCYPQYNCGGLMTKTQLRNASYATDEASLPPPVGCYRDYNFKFIMLYDPSQARKNRVQKRNRVTISLSEVYWPRAWISFLEEAIRRDRQETNFQFRQDVLQMAYHLAFFTPDEIERMAGPYLRVSIPPTLIHRSYAAFLASGREQTLLLRAILKVYQAQRTR